MTIEPAIFVSIGASRQLFANPLGKNPPGICVRILITGICGFVGSVIAESLQQHLDNAEIFGIDNLSRSGSELNRGILQARGVRFFHGDVRLPSDLDDLPAADLVIDAAANPSVLAGLSGNSAARQLVEHNCLGTINLLEYCRRHQSCFVMLSTSRVYSIEALARLPLKPIDRRLTPDLEGEAIPGFSVQGISEQFSTDAPVSLYGATKLASEVLALEYGNAFSFPVWVNRCGVLAGAGQFGKADQGIFSFWIHSWRKGLPLKYLGFGGKGYQVRDCMHPTDLVPLIIKQFVCGSAKNTNLLNISGGVNSSMSLAELSEWCRDRFGNRDVEPDGTVRPFDLPWVVLDSSKAASVWDWKPTVTREAILESIATHAEEHEDWMEVSRRS